MSPGFLSLIHHVESFAIGPSVKAGRGVSVERSYTDSSSCYELSKLESAISRLGSSAHTAWLEPQYNIFTYDEDGATLGVVGYVESKGFAVVLGEPLVEPGCAKRARNVAVAFERKMALRNIAPIWTCVSEGFLKDLSQEDHIIIRVAQEVWQYFIALSSLNKI